MRRGPTWAHRHAISLANLDCKAAGATGWNIAEYVDADASGGRKQATPQRTREYNTIGAIV